MKNLPYSSRSRHTPQSSPSNRGFNPNPDRSKGFSPKANGDRTTKDFYQAAVWSIEDRNRDFPTDDPDRIFTRKLLLSAVKWADEFLKEWMRDGMPSLVIVNAEASTSELFAEMLVRCFKWYGIKGKQLPSILWNVEDIWLTEGAK